MAERKTLILIPTYNERENVHKLYAGIRRVAPDSDILFVDDNSPDGTGELLEGLAKQDSRLSVLHRKERSGVGSAHKAGIFEAYRRGYETLITMDADFTHSPDYIPEFVKLSDEKEIVVGSRYLKSKSLDGWNPIRKFLTTVAHFLTTVLLDLKYDSTGAFRVYRLDRINKDAFSLVRSASYSFFFESLYILNLNRYSIGEIAIHLPPRTYGSSKMRFRDIFKSLSLLLRIFFRRLFLSKSLILEDKISGHYERY